MCSKAQPNTAIHLLFIECLKFLSKSYRSLSAWLCRSSWISKADSTCVQAGSEKVLCVSINLLLMLECFLVSLLFENLHKLSLKCLL